MEKLIINKRRRKSKYIFDFLTNFCDVQIIKYKIYGIGIWYHLMMLDYFESMG